MTRSNRSPRAARQTAALLWHQHWRAGAAGLIALAGLSLIALAPAGLAVGVQRLADRSGGADPARLLGSEVRDGPVSFVVHQIRCGPATAPEATHGRVCELTIEARNAGPSPVTVPGDRQHLVGPDGLHLLPVEEDAEPFGTLPPGTAATAVLRYDLPAHADVTHVRVRGGAYTDGVTVGLGGPPFPR